MQRNINCSVFTYLLVLTERMEVEHFHQKKTEHFKEMDNLRLLC